MPKYHVLHGIFYSLFCLSLRAFSFPIVSHVKSSFIHWRSSIFVFLLCVHKDYWDRDWNSELVYSKSIFVCFQPLLWSCRVRHEYVASWYQPYFESLPVILRVGDSAIEISSCAEIWALVGHAVLCISRTTAASLTLLERSTFLSWPYVLVTNY